MAISAETRTQLIGLSVAMLGQAPGAKRLNEWVGDLNDEDKPKTIVELAGHIAETEAFTTTYPIFQTSEEFADKFLGGLLAGVSDAAMKAAKDIVLQQLNGGAGRGEVAHGVVVALMGIAEAGSSHAAWADFGDAATAFHNKVAVAEHHTVERTMAEPSAGALDGVDHTEASREEAIARIDLVRQDRTADAETDVKVGSADGTTLVNVNGGKSVSIGLEADGTEQSESVETVRVFDIERDSDGTKQESKFSHYDLRTDFDGFVLDPSGDRVKITPSGLETVHGKDETQTPLGDGGDIFIKVVRPEGATNLKAEIPVTNELGRAIRHTDDYPLHYDPIEGNFEWGGYAGKLTGNAIPEKPADSALPTTVGVSMDRVRKETTMEVYVPGNDPTVSIFSDAIRRVELHDTSAVALIVNEFRKADGKAMPGDLALAVNNYKNGKVCIKGASSPENIDLEVFGKPNSFRLAIDGIKTLDIDAAGDLKELEVTTFDDKDKTPAYMASGTLESITVGGAGDVVMPGLAGMDKLKTIDASGSMGMVHFRSHNGESGAKAAFVELKALETVMTGSGNDRVELATSNADKLGKLKAIHTMGGNDRVVVEGMHHTKNGIEVLLGDGDDHYHGTASNSQESEIDGGAGMDTLRLTDGKGSTYTKDKKTMSVYKNFEILDAGGGKGAYDITGLGVDSIRFSAGTADKVILKNAVSVGMGFHVESGKAGTGITAEVDYQVAKAKEAPDFREANDSSVNSRDFTLDLVARGGATDKSKTATAAGKYSGEATVNLDLQAGIVAMIVNSDARKGGKATAAGYTNTVIVTSSGLEKVKLNGGAMVDLSGDLDAVRLVDATANKAGAIVDVGAANDATDAKNKLTMRGGDGDDDFTGGVGMDVLMGNKGDDTLTGRAGDDMLHGGDGEDTIVGGDGDDEIRGGAGEDKLTGGGGADEFEFLVASDSRLSGYNAKTNAAEGMDTITDFVSGTDMIVLSEDLYDKVRGDIRGTDDWGNWKSVDTDGAGSGTERTSITSINGTPTGYKAGEDTDNGAMNLKDFIGDGKGLFESRGEDDSDSDSVGADLTEYSIALITQEGAGVENGLWVLFDVDEDGDFDHKEDMVIFLAGATDLAGTDIIEAS